MAEKKSTKKKAAKPAEKKEAPKAAAAPALSEQELARIQRAKDSGVPGAGWSVARDPADF